MSGHLSLCSGIGGLELGFGLTPDAFAEIDPAPASVLSQHWADVPNLGDWTQMDNFNDYPSLISGGLPCQPLSAAGKGKTDTDDRYLFDDLVRILRASDVRPTILLENVRGILYPRNAVPFWRLISALADLGYVGRWEVVRASDAGAPHKRERWICLARHSDNLGAHGAGPRSPRRGELADANPLPPHPDSEAGKEFHGNSIEASGDRERRGDVERRGLSALRQSKYGPAVARWEGMTRPCPPPLDEKARLAVPFVEWMMGFPDGWTGSLNRTSALKALGNAVVPQQAALAGEILNG